MTADVQRALPHWGALTRDGLYLPWCEPCGRYLPLGVGICHGCGGISTGWRRSSGKGEVWSYTVVRRPFVASAPWPLPYVVALIDLAEGSRVPGAIVGAGEDDVRVGLKVSLMTGADGSGDPVLAFEPESRSSARGGHPKPWQRDPEGPASDAEKASTPRAGT